MKLMCANGGLESKEKRGTGFVSRQRICLPVSITSAHIVSMANIAFPFKFSVSLPLSLSVGLAAEQMFLFLSTPFPSPLPELVTNVCEYVRYLSRLRRGGGVGAAQVRACALLRETASTSPRPSYSTVPALQIHCSRFFFPWFFLSLVTRFNNPRDNSACK